MGKPEQDEWRDVAQLGRNVARMLLERTAAEAASGNLRDPAGAARNAAVVAGVAIDKAHALEDRPKPPPPITDPRADGLKLLAELGITVEPSPRETRPALPGND